MFILTATLMRQVMMMLLFSEKYLHPPSVHVDLSITPYIFPQPMCIFSRTCYHYVADMIMCHVDGPDVNIKKCNFVLRLGPI
jgi:hypothetical protein